mmetsp:Transcript_35466/g.111616  ORF Transcript_35466/g.111616 Transcript_35466/m.111616 type:complete len:315 (+) Transcript_35466:2542-3486(+)
MSSRSMARTMRTCTQIRRVLPRLISPTWRRLLPRLMSPSTWTRRAWWSAGTRGSRLRKRKRTSESASAVREGRASRSCERTCRSCPSRRRRRSISRRRFRCRYRCPSRSSPQQHRQRRTILQRRMILARTWRPPRASRSRSRATSSTATRPRRIRRACPSRTRRTRPGNERPPRPKRRRPKPRGGRPSGRFAPRARSGASKSASRLRLSVSVHYVSVSCHAHPLCLELCEKIQCCLKIGSERTDERLFVFIRLCHALLRYYIPYCTMHLFAAVSPNHSLHSLAQNWPPRDKSPVASSQELQAPTTPSHHPPRTS